MVEMDDVVEFFVSLGVIAWCGSVILLFFFLVVLLGYGAGSVMGLW